MTFAALGFSEIIICEREYTTPAPIQTSPVVSLDRTVASARPIMGTDGQPSFRVSCRANPITLSRGYAPSTDLAEPGPQQAPEPAFPENADSLVIASTRSCLGALCLPAQQGRTTATPTLLA